MRPGERRIINAAGSDKLGCVNIDRRSRDGNATFLFGKQIVEGEVKGLRTVEMPMPI